MSLDHRMHGLVIDVSKPIKQTISMVARPDKSGRVCILVEAGIMGRDQIFIDPVDARGFASQLSWAAGEAAATGNGGSDADNEEENNYPPKNSDEEDSNQAGT